MLQPSLFPADEPFSRDPLIKQAKYELKKDRSVVKTATGKIEKLGTSVCALLFLSHYGQTSGK